MLATIIAAIVGSLITGLIVYLRGWFSSKAVDKSVGERIEAVEAQADVDRKKREDELNVEANKIIITDDARAALELLRKKFPGTHTTVSN